MQRTVTHDTFSLERDYPASPKRVFGAFADPEAKAQWFGPPDNVGARSMDFRVGGRDSLVVTVPDGGPTFTFEALYQDIVAPERIIFSYEMSMDGKRISVSVTTVEFIAHGAGTRLILTEQGVFLDGLDSAEARRRGTEEWADALGHYLETAP